MLKVSSVEIKEISKKYAQIQKLSLDLLFKILIQVFEIEI